MNIYCRCMMLIFLTMQGEDLCASGKKPHITKTIAASLCKPFDLEDFLSSSSDEIDTPPRLAQSKYKNLQQGSDAQEAKKSSPLQRLTVRQSEDVDTKAAYSSLDEDSSDSDFTELRRSPVFSGSQQSSWCDDFSLSSGDEKDSGSERELVSVSRFIYPDTSDVKPYVQRPLSELKDIEDEDL